MKLSIACSLVAGVLATFAIASAAGQSGKNGGNHERAAKVLEADTMVGVSGSLRGATNAIRGVPGGGAPWVLDRAEVELSQDGKLEVEVEGLIIPDRGSNPVAFFRAIVSCLTLDTAGNVTTLNLTTLNGAEVMIGNPLNGDAEIEAQLTLPEPCIAPIVFVTSPTGSWFATTGF
ncbi:MAG TPA: hypothetical protein VFL84_08905 [Gammaproteobacteria bacterium]|nr:hypothetical protein [Gammaproteobacteria bacterium]